jgi:phosphopantothenoylcysteine decarboxylase
VSRPRRVGRSTSMPPSSEFGRDEAARKQAVSPADGFPALAGREVVLGVAGGVAAYKAAMLTSLLVKQSVGVTAVLTDAATAFVGEATFAALTSRPVARRVFDPGRFPLGGHIELAAGTDLVVVAPATADFLAKAAHGVADDLLTTLLLAAECPVILAPAMNAAMWAKPAVQRNVRQLVEDGLGIIEPVSGWLACRREGAGRMAEPEAIASEIARVLAGGELPKPGVS